MPDLPLRTAMANSLIDAGLLFQGSYSEDGENVRCVWPDALDILCLDAELMDLSLDESIQQAAAKEVTVHDGTVTLRDILDHLSVWSTVPACVAYWDWMCGEFMPAIMRHGYYDPARNHEPPPGEELNAIERREGGRDLFSDIIPGFRQQIGSEE